MTSGVASWPGATHLSSHRSLKSSKGFPIGATGIGAAGSGSGVATVSLERLKNFLSIAENYLMRTGRSTRIFQVDHFRTGRPPPPNHTRTRPTQWADAQEKPATLMEAAVQAGSEALTQAQDDVVISGERNLLSVSDFSGDMSHLRRAFDLFEQKTQLMRLLDVSSQAEGVRIYIGGESQIVPFEELSIVSAPYEVDGVVVGTLGVIGPTRMPYDRMIQIVDITSKLVSNALSHFK